MNKITVVFALIGMVGAAFGVGSPTGLKVAPIDFTQTACNLDCSAQLSWTAPTDGTPKGYRVYRRLSAHEQPTLAGATDGATTSFTDTAATAGRAYRYTVTCFDDDGESAESSPIDFRKVHRISGADCGAWSWTGDGIDTPNKFTIDGLYDCNLTKGTRSNGWTTFVDSFAKNAIITEFRVYRPDSHWGTAQGSYWVRATPADGTAAKYFTKSAADQGNYVIQTAGASTWEAYPTHADYADTEFVKAEIRSTSAYYSFFNEIEYYGWLVGDGMASPEICAPVLGNEEALLTWEGVAEAASYSVYRRQAQGAWECVASGITSLCYKDADLTDGVTYTYRVAAVAVNGDEASNEAGVTLTATAKATEIPVAYALTAAAIDFSQSSCNVDCSAQLSWSLVSANCYDQVRVYRFLAGHEEETPAPIATLDKATANWTDASAEASVNYIYKVACYDSATGREGSLSSGMEYRRIENVALATKGNVTLNNPTLANGTVENVNNGNATDNAVCKDNSAASKIVMSFKEGHRPLLRHVRLNFGTWGENKNMQQYFYGYVLRGESKTQYEFDGTTTKTRHVFTQKAWNHFPVADTLQGDTWESIEFGGGNYYGNCRELEAYGYVPGVEYLTAPELSNPVAERKSVSLSWTAVEKAASYKVYRKKQGGAWVVAIESVTGTEASDSGVTFDGTTYTYRVAAVAANGDEISSEGKTVLCPAGAPYWWNFLNVKSVAFPGASAYPNPSQVKPHFMGRDKAGTLLAVPMSTDNASHPAVTFDFAALASANMLGELTIAESGMRQYGIASDFGGGINCWKGAAVSADLVVMGNGAAESAVAVVERASGNCTKYRLLNSDGGALSFAMDGGIDFDASGDWLYTNDGTANNRIVKWRVDASARTLKKTAEYAATSFTRIRNLAIYTIADEEYALFGEGSEKTGKIGAMKLSDGTVMTLITDSTNLNGDIMNVKLAAADGETYVVAQLDDAAVGVYSLDTTKMTATLEKAIDAATMKQLYGTDDGGQYRNFEMTADGRYAMVMNNAGANTRLVVIGANERLVPAEKPELTVVSDYSTKYRPTLSWTEEEGVLAESVRIYRKQVGKTGAAVLTDVPLGTMTYVDETAVGGITYAYAIAFVHTVNNRDLIGASSDEVEALALTDLKTKKKDILTSDSKAQGTLVNLFDDDTTTVHGYSRWEEKAAMQFTERVQLMAARYMPANWGTVHRGDNLKVSGNNNSEWTKGRTQVGVGPVVDAETWYDITLNESAATDEGWEYLVLASGYTPEPYLNLREVDFYGAIVSARKSAESRISEVAREDAPTATVADCNSHQLVWNESGELAGVAVLRSRTPDGPFVEVGRVDPNVGTFNDETAVDGVVYYYQLAYLNECEGVVYAGMPSSVVVDYGRRLDTTDYRSAILQSWTDNWSGGYAFSDDLSNTVNGPYEARFGVAFKESVEVNAIALRGPEWAVNDNGYRIDNIAVYTAPSGISGIADTAQSGYKQITDEAVSQFTQVATTPSGCHTANEWYVTPTTASDYASYLHCYRAGWFASINGMRIYGYSQAEIEAAKKEVVWPVENLAATMSDDRAVLSWTLANDLATSIRIERRVNGGAWETLATPTASTTSFVDDTAVIGAHNEYRVWTADDEESVYRSVVMTPLLTKGNRAFVARCSAASDPIFVDAFAVASKSAWNATLNLPSTDPEVLGVSGEVRIVVSTADVDGNSVQVIRRVSTGVLELYLKGPGHESGELFAADASVADCDGIRLVRDGLKNTAFYHTPTGGWVQFASASFASDPFASSTIFVGAATHTTGVTEATPTAFNIGSFKLRIITGLQLIIR